MKRSPVKRVAERGGSIPADDDTLVFARRPKPCGVPVDLADGQAVAELCSRHGVDEVGLKAAIHLVGPMPLALDYYFASRSSRRKVVTAEMRATRASARSSGTHPDEKS